MVVQNMLADNELIARLKHIVSAVHDRTAALQGVADTIRHSGAYRWVGLYEVDHHAQIVRNVAFSGPGAPAYPEFPITSGLTGAAVAERRTINVGNVEADERYLTAFGNTKSEIIVPIFGPSGDRVIGTIDVESDRVNAFRSDTETLLESCAQMISKLWR